MDAPDRPVVGAKSKCPFCVANLPSGIGDGA